MLIRQRGGFQDRYFGIADANQGERGGHAPERSYSQLVDAQGMVHEGVHQPRWADPVSQHGTSVGTYDARLRARCEFPLSLRHGSYAGSRGDAQADAHLVGLGAASS